MKALFVISTVGRNLKNVFCGMYKTLGTHNYYVYILTNKVKTVLYIGFTNNLKDRVYQHNTPDLLSKSFTAKYKCFYLVYWEHYSDVQIAIDRETELKKWRRDKKDALISGFNPEWKFLERRDLRFLSTLRLRSK